MVLKVSLWGFQERICVEKWSQNFDSGTRTTIFGTPKTPKVAVQGYQKWYFGCSNQNSKTTFQHKYPLEPPFKHFWNHFGSPKSDLQPFYTFWLILVIFTGGGIFLGKVYDFQSQFHLSKCYSFLTSGYHRKALCVQISNNYRHCRYCQNEFDFLPLKEKCKNR